MAKKRRRRVSLLTKVINIGVLLLAAARPIQLFTEGGDYLGKMAWEASMGLSTGKFRKDVAIKFYGPMLGAIILKKAISMVRKTARV